jgi:hypothetical protein
MARSHVRKIVAAVAGLGFLGVPAQAGLVDDECAFGAIDLLATSMANGGSRSHSSSLCTPHPSAGGATSPPPEGEYLDLVTNVVYRQEGASLRPVAVGLPTEGYTELTTTDFYADCGSTSIFGCAVAQACATQLCQMLRIAVTNCHDVHVRIQYFSPSGTINGQRIPGGPAFRDPRADDSSGLYEDFTYPSTCERIDLPVKPNEKLPPGTPGVLPQVVVCPKAPCVTTLSTSFVREPGCWSFNVAAGAFEADAFGDSGGREVVAQDVLSTLWIDGKQFGPANHSVICHAA